MIDLYTDREKEQRQEIKRLRNVIPEIRSLFVQAAFQFTLNFPPDFIEQAWSETPWLQNHLRNKFTGLCKKDQHGSPNAVLAFYSALDHKNRAVLTQYIVDWFNYKFPVK